MAFCALSGSIETKCLMYLWSLQISYRSATIDLSIDLRKTFGVNWKNLPLRGMAIRNSSKSSKIFIATLVVFERSQGLVTMQPFVFLPDL